jgi:lipoyl-dependent peroxiredoxin subunit D
MSMESLEALRERLPEALRDLKLNLQTATAPGTLGPAQRLGVALAVAAAARHAALRRALVALAEREVGRPVVEDALAAAALMGMNNVYYRFRHLIGKASYSEKPARLRMQRIAKPATNKIDFELFCLAVSAVNGCETCMRAHEKVVLEGGLSEEQVHDAIRIAASVHGAAVALDVAEDLAVSSVGVEATIP